MSDSIILTVYIQPGAKQTQISGKHGEHIKIRLQAPPTEGKANKALIDFLAQRLKLNPSSITIIRGEKARLKTIAIESSGLKEEALLKLLINF
ncbi:YggU family protein [Coxiella burnetii]|uniref:UPF0235 protein CBUD_1117 n=1 Tax=Coxiella burnetii (strain Dugway 5J108-111) TaxID=434922 RepID=A9KCJ1_COXBN|nr:DUF167 domain-containing protein [Coxiella burnetii]ABS76554.1 hypothetical cytosolic protein [Coxiella burnetii Dugway 5J108-111]OYK80264.1 YggU family protein [Coxiella burnetii]OYK82346.1 YggU family protein [Coxiella burnetii]